MYVLIYGSKRDSCMCICMHAWTHGASITVRACRACLAPRTGRNTEAQAQARQRAAHCTRPHRVCVAPLTRGALIISDDDLIHHSHVLPLPVRPSHTGICSSPATLSPDAYPSTCTTGHTHSLLFFQNLCGKLSLQRDRDRSTPTRSREESAAASRHSIVPANTVALCLSFSSLALTRKGTREDTRLSRSTWKHAQTLMRGIFDVESGAQGILLY